MKKLICLILALTFCFGLACTAFADEANDDFLSSPGTEPECDHPGTKLVGQVDSTCTNEGYTGDLVCEHCGKVIEEGKRVPKAPHNFENGSCTVCGADENNPQTGDTSFVFVWMIIMGVAAVSLVGVTVVYRKKFANQ